MLVFYIKYVAPFEHLKGSVISEIVRNEKYKEICIHALQLFDKDIVDMMIFKNELDNSAVEYLRHKKLGDMPLASFGDGIKKFSFWQMPLYRQWGESSLLMK